MIIKAYRHLWPFTQGDEIIFTLSPNKYSMHAKVPLQNLHKQNTPACCFSSELWRLSHRPTQLHPQTFSQHSGPVKRWGWYFYFKDRCTIFTTEHDINLRFLHVFEHIKTIDSNFVVYYSTSTRIYSEGGKLFAPHHHLFFRVISRV